MKKLKLFRKIKSILSILLISLLIIPLCSGIGIHAKEKNTESNEYKIYPIPHSVVYDNEQFVMSDRVHVVFEEGIDKATQNFLEEVITDYGKTVVHLMKIQPFAAYRSRIFLTYNIEDLLKAFTEGGIINHGKAL